MPYRMPPGRKIVRQPKFGPFSLARDTVKINIT